MNIGVGCAEGRLLEEACGVVRGDDGDGRSAVHQRDEVGRGCGTGSGVQDLQIEVAGFGGLRVAVSWPALLKVVGTGEPFWRTCAPVMNF